MHAEPKKSLSPAFRAALDFAPLAVFFVAYKLFGLLPATAAIIATTLVSLTVIYWKERKLAPLPLVSGVMIVVFGGLTIFLQDEQFVKMKPTMVNLVFATILLGGLLFKKALLKPVLHYAVQLEDRGWFLLSLRWGLFFLCLAGLNEFIWRNFSTDFWVNFKVFGMLTITMIFTMLQLPLMKRYETQEASSTPPHP